MQTVARFFENQAAKFGNRKMMCTKWPDGIQVYFVGKTSPIYVLNAYETGSLLVYPTQLHKSLKVDPRVSALVYMYLLLVVTHTNSNLWLRVSSDTLLASMNNLDQQIALVERISFVYDHTLDVARNRS